MKPYKENWFTIARGYFLVFCLWAVIIMPCVLTALWLRFYCGRKYSAWEIPGVLYYYAETGKWWQNPYANETRIP